MSKAHWLGLSTLPGVGGVTFRKLIDRFGNADAVFDASDADLAAIPRFTETAIKQLRRVNLAQLESEIVDLADAGISILTWEDETYPANLLPINGAPPILFVRGYLDFRDQDAVAIVGTREPIPESAALTEMLARELAQRGLTVVSGLARGIDTAAHQGALLAENGRTIAVLGSGLDAIHTQENIPLAEQISNRGAVLTEYPPRTRARGSQLMARDRIVSGMSLAVMVIQANEKSGSLDTAQKAQKQGRLLFAVPGSPGTDALIRKGIEPLAPDRIDFDRLAARILDQTPGQKPQQLTLF